MGHYAFNCRFVTKNGFKPTGGKYQHKWLKTKQHWRKFNPPNHEGYYTCHICGGAVAADEMELDHVISRSRAPELRYELSNLKPSHHDCNSRKGSLSLDEMV